MKKIKVSWTTYCQSMEYKHVHGFFWVSLSFPSLASRDSWQWDAGLFVLLMWCSSTLTKWTRAIPTALSLDCFASTQFTWKALALLHTFSTHSFKWFSVLSIERRGKDNDPVEILERTEYNLGVQLTFKIFKAMLCWFLLQLQDSGPRQILSKVVRVLVSKHTSTSRTIFSSVFCLLPSMCAETYVKATPALIPFLPFHPIKCILSWNVPWRHDSKPWHVGFTGFFARVPGNDLQSLIMTVSRGSVQLNPKLEPQSWSFCLELWFHDISFQ